MKANSTSIAIARSVAAATGIFLLALGVCFAASLLGFVPRDLIDEVAGTSGAGAGEATLRAVAATILPLAAGYFLLSASVFLPLPRRVALPSPPRSFGGLIVRQEAVAELVRRKASEVQGIDARRAEARFRRDSGRWDVLIRVDVSQDLLREGQFPGLRKAVNDALVFHTGIPLGRLRLRAQLASRPRSQFAFLH